MINAEGEVTEIYGRKILGKRLRKGTPQHLYLPGSHAGVWNTEGIARQQEVILCEALLDAMTFWVHGYRNVAASYGTSGFTADHLGAFKAARIERVLIAYDRDEAGNRAAIKLAQQLQAEGLGCYRLHFPKGEPGGTREQALGRTIPVLATSENLTLPTIAWVNLLGFYKKQPYYPAQESAVASYSSMLLPEASQAWACSSQ
ncbi:MAG: toprim domain-containing protein [Xanthomonadales bacterium]|nr:toprim domain-containing protein [Xanthomonadales bacterium]